MKIKLYNELGDLIKVIFNVVDIKVLNDEYFIEVEKDGFSVKYQINCKKAKIKEVVLIYEEVGK